MPVLHARLAGSETKDGAHVNSMCTWTVGLSQVSADSTQTLRSPEASQSASR